MSDPIEDALSRMKPAELSPEQMARLTAARAEVAPKEPEKSRGRPAGSAWLTRWLLPVMGCAAVALATVMVLESDKRGEPQRVLADNHVRPFMTNPARQEGLVPFDMEDRLVGAREVGLVVAPNQRPIRIMEFDWLQSDTLKPGDGGSAVRVETTRRQVVPVALEVY
jgi:hypothetical protein